MTVANQNTKDATSADTARRRLPWRDWVLLPVIGLLTMCLLTVSIELVARKIYPRFPAQNGRCMTFKDASVGIGAIPNSVCRIQSEGQWMEYRFNGSGFRAGMEADPKAPGMYRIVMVGSSSAMGMGVPREKSFAALLPAELSKLTGRKVELYNEALTPNHPEVIARWFNEVHDAHPDLILWIVTPYDVQVGGEGPEEEPDPKAGAIAKTLFLIKNRPAGESVLDAMRQVWTSYSRTAVLLRHILDKSQSQFMKSYLLGDPVSGYLRTTPSPLWQKRLKLFDGYAASIGAQAKAAGVPLVVVQLPSRAQVLMASTGSWPSAYDPYALDHELNAIVTSHGGAYIDVLPAFRNTYDLEKVFQYADEHPNDEGHEIISKDIASQLTEGLIPQLKISIPAQSQVARQ
jgi:hypothetical protein